MPTHTGEPTTEAPTMTETPAQQAVVPFDRSTSILDSYTKEDLDLIVDVVAPSLRDSKTGNVYVPELKLYLRAAKTAGLDPLRKQIYAVMRWDGRLQRMRMSIQTGIDGFRAVANSHANYDGQVGPFWCGPDGIWKDVWVEDGPPLASKVGILRTGCEEPIWGVVRYKAYVQLDKQGNPTKFWRDMDAEQLAKCAEAVGLRKAFPERLSGLYTGDEMAQADVAVDAQIISSEPLATRKAGDGKAAADKLADKARERAAEAVPAGEPAAPVETPPEPKPPQATVQDVLDLDPKVVLTLDPLDPANPDGLEEWRNWDFQAGAWDTWAKNKMADTGPLAQWTAEELIKGPRDGGRHNITMSVVGKAFAKFGPGLDLSPDRALKAARLDYALAVMERRYIAEAKLAGPPAARAGRRK